MSINFTGGYIKLDENTFVNSDRINYVRKNPAVKGHANTEIVFSATNNEHPDLLRTSYTPLEVVMAASCADNGIIHSVLNEDEKNKIHTDSLKYLF